MFKYLDQQIFSFVLLQCLLLALYLILLSLLYLNQLGRGLFCLCFLANLFFIRRVLFAPIYGLKYSNQIYQLITYKHTTTANHIHHPTTHPGHNTQSPSISYFQQQYKLQYQFPKTNMNCLDTDQLYRQNQKLKQKLKQQITSNNCSSADLQTQYQIVNRQKSQIQDLKHEIKLMKKIKDQDQIQRANLQYRSARVIQGLEEEVDQYKRKYQKLENKIAPLIDHDTVRLKVLNQVEGNHQLQITILKNKVSQLKDQVLKYKRQREVLKHSLQNQRMDRQEQVKRIKSQQNSQFAQDSINYLTFSMWKDMEARLKNDCQNARKQAQFYKEKYFAAQKKYHARIVNSEGGVFNAER